MKSYPGRDGVVLLVQQSDGRKFRAELPVSVDSRSPVMRSEIQDLFGSQVWRASGLRRSRTTELLDLRSSLSRGDAVLAYCAYRIQSLKQSCRQGRAGPSARAELAWWATRDTT
ncbi:MAG: hypothetical protein ACLTMP_13760 [Eggerthella lenta]